MDAGLGAGVCVWAGVCVVVVCAGLGAGLGAGTSVGTSLGVCFGAGICAGVVVVVGAGAGAGADVGTCLGLCLYTIYQYFLPIRLILIYFIILYVMFPTVFVTT